MTLQNNKSLGQHWLKDRQVLDDIAEFAGAGGLVVEIGPGLGTLTSSLLRRFDKVIAVEFDEKLANNLPNSFPGKNLEVINDDFLRFDLSKISGPYVVAGNIPYYITSPIIDKLLHADPAPDRIVLLIQKEVAERIAAEDGRESVLSLTTKNRADVTLGPVVPKNYFTPPPKVDSEIIILEPHAPRVSDETLNLIKRGFSAPRKKLLKNLGLSKAAVEETFRKLKISLDARPADLDLFTWDELRESL